MPENKLENFVFTLIMAFLMVYAMICYNIALNNVYNGEAGYGAYKPRRHRGHAVLFYAADTLRSDRLSDVPGDESNRDFPVQGIPRSGPCQCLSADGSVQLSHGALLADLFCRSCRKMDFQNIVQKKTRSEIKEAAPLWQKMFINRVCRI